MNYCTCLRRTNPCDDVQIPHCTTWHYAQFVGVDTKLCASALRFAHTHWIDGLLEHFVWLMNNLNIRNATRSDAHVCLGKSKKQLSKWPHACANLVLHTRGHVRSWLCLRIVRRTRDSVTSLRNSDDVLLSQSLL